MFYNPKDARKKKNISQQLLAKLSGVGRYKITLFECEYAEPTLLEISQMRAAITKYKGEKSLGNSKNKTT